jgi:AsmA protein
VSSSELEAFVRRLVIVVVGLVAILIIVALALPFLIDANQFKPRVEAEATKALGREVKLGNLSLSIFSGGVKAQNLQVAENPAYGKGPFLTASSMEIGVEMMPLITSRKLNVESFTIEQPQVNLVHGSNGKWNVSTLGGSSQGAGGESSSTAFKVGKFAIHDGRVTVVHLGAQSKPSTYENVELTANNLSLTSAFPYELSTTPPGGGSIKVSGNFGPLSEKVADQTPLTADIKVEKFSLGESGFVDPASGMQGLVSLDANLKSDGKTAKLTGHGSGDKLCLVQGCAPSKTPVGLEFGTDYDLARQTGALNKGVLKLGNSAANLGGAFDMSGAATKLNMKVDAASLAVGDIEGILPAIGVVLPSGANLQGGTAAAHATIAGPVDALITTGTVEVNNTKLTGYDLGSKLAAISKLAGIGSSKETLIQLFASNMKVSPQGTQADNLKLVVPGIGTLTGGGVIGPKNDLNFKMHAQLQTQGNALGALTQAAGFGGKNANIPFHITGTTANPVFTPDLGGAVGGILSGAKGQQANPGGLVESLGGLFGKKKKQ